MILDGLDGNIPSPHVVALFAIRPHLAPVDIGVARGAGSADVAEHQFGVALGAAYILVHAAQWVTGGVVIKLGDGPKARLRFDRRL